MSPSEATGFAVMTSRRAGTNSRLECRRAFDLMGEGFVLILQIEAIKLPLDLAADDPLNLLRHPPIAILIVFIVLGRSRPGVDGAR